MKKIISIILCIIMTIVACSNFSFVLATETTAETDQISLDYDALLTTAFIVNSSWSDADLQSESRLTFTFRGKHITESYDATRHFSDFDTAYNYYLSQNPDILTGVPVFIFAPGNYSSLITVRYSAIILGANAGINPNTTEEWTLDAMSDGVKANPNRTEETIFSAGITRTTRSSDNDAKWSYTLEQTEAETGKKADIKLIIDGIKITGSVGISHYDYSNRLYTDLKLNGNAFEYTPTGNRTTLTAFLNSVVDEFSGSGANALFSARCNSMNKNDVIMNNVRITNVASSASFLFNKFFRNLTIDGMYYANNATQIFGAVTTGSTFAGNAGAKTAEYDQNIEIKNSIFYKNSAINPISLGNSNAGSGYTKMTADIHHNFFYDAVYGSSGTNYWGIFLVNSAKSGVEYTVNVTDNVIHQQSTTIQTLFNGNTNLQKSKTTVNFNRNKVTGDIRCIYPNTSWNSNYDNLINTSISYDFSHNFCAFSPTDIGKRPDWSSPPQTYLANGYDYTKAPFYIDYDLSILSTDFEITEVKGLGSNVQVDGHNITADCTDMSGIVTPEIICGTDSTVVIYSDAGLKNPIQSIDLSKVGKASNFYVKISKDANFVIGLLTVVTGKYSDISTVQDIDISKFNFPVITVNTVDNAQIVDKENYVDCAVSISNTEEDYCLDEKVAGIRFRGNSTLLYSDKKAYRIKFDKKQDLFDMGKAKSWVLLANAFDKTMVRNTIAFAIGQQLDLEFTSEYRYVNLYLNGEYKGLYLLCEQTQTGSTRVDVEEDESGKVDTGYLIEMAGNGDPDEDRHFSIDPVPTEEFGTGVDKNWRDIILGYLKTPELEVCTDEQVEFISEYVNNANYAILTQDWEGFNALCDVESFAKHFIVNTILNNGDAGFQIYMYKKENGGKLYAGPLWDFDQSAAASTHCGDSYNSWYTGTVNPWFDSFSHWPEFLKLAKGIYMQNHSEIEDIITYYTADFYPANTYDFHANDVLWNNLENEYWRIPEAVKSLTSYSANFLHLATWFENRLAWFDGNAYKLVTISPDAIFFDNSEYTLEKNNTLTLSVTTQPAYTDPYTLEWASSDTTVATVEDGVVTAIKDGNTVITATVSGSSVSTACTVNVYTKPADTPDNRLPQVVLNESGNGVVTDMRGSWATRVYWGYIGTEEIEYKWFDDFRLGCGTDYNADFAPRANKAYRFTKVGYYRFVLKCILNPYDSVENYRYKDVVYTFYFDGHSNVEVPSLTIIDDNTVQINKNGQKVIKLYYGNIGNDNVPYSWFNDFWGKALGTKTYTADFDVKEKENYKLTLSGYYNFVIVYEDTDGTKHELVYTAYAGQNAPIIKKEGANAVLDLSEGMTGATVNKLYYANIGNENTDFIDGDHFLSTYDYVGSWNPKDGTKYALTESGYYRFVIQYKVPRTDKEGLFHVYDVVLTIDNR